MAINASLAQWLFGVAHAHPLLDAAIVFFAKYFSYLLVLIAIGFLLAERNRRQRLFFLLETLLALLLSRGLLTEGIRFFYHAPRPFEVLSLSPLVQDPLPGTSFPSGHAAFYFALATVFLLHNRKWGLWFFSFALVNGIARIASGIHWPVDILGGAAVGIGSALVVRFMLRRTSRALRIQTAPTPPPRETPPAETGAGAA
ncbi:MAG: phosphatase PAP2 family protein [Candidatus Liptonbacteria bacterium]|nr:phosphatase PAP2 family protein [Candidatus Liptonbacteria bacterium]